jgi:hypothetical protein
VTRLVQLYDEEGMIIALGENYELAAYAANSLALEMKALAYAREARRYFAAMYGGDSP